MIHFKHDDRDHDGPEGLAVDKGALHARGSLANSGQDEIFLDGWAQALQQEDRISG